MFLDINLDNVEAAVETKQKQITHQREALAKAAVSEEWKNNKVKTLHDMVQTIAQLEGELEILQVLDHGMKRLKSGEVEMTTTDIYNHLISAILTGPDDSWSGRGNDLRRAVYDAKLEMLRDLKYVLKD